MTEATPESESAPAEEGQASAATAPLLKRIVHGSFWVMLGFGSAQVLRLGGNICLSWLLVPEDFGLMGLVTTLLIGLQLFSDLGIGLSVVRSDRGEDERFLRTAWTLQVGRGVALWLAACAITYPASAVYAEELLKLLPVAAISAMLRGLRSVNWHLAARRLDVRVRVMIEVSRSVVALSTMLCWALFISDSVWALVAGALVGGTWDVVASHILLRGISFGFGWDWSAFKEMYHFGKWLTISTMITFLAGHVDKLLLGALLPLSVLGMYWIAQQFAQLPQQLVVQLTGQIGFPALSELYRKSPERFEQRLGHLRQTLVLGAHALLLGMILLGPSFIALMYPPTYMQVGWLLQLLGCGAIAGAVNQTYGPAYLAIGSSLRNTITVATMFVLVVTVTGTGYWLDGPDGFLLALVLVQWLRYPMDMLLSDTAGFWQPKIDLPAMGVSGLLAVGALFVSPYLTAGALVVAPHLKALVH